MLSPDDRCSTRPLNRRRPVTTSRAEVHDERALRREGRSVFIA